MDQGTHVCIICKQTKPVSGFYRRSGTGKIVNTCKICRVAQNKAYNKYGPQKQGRHHKYERTDGLRECRLCKKVLPETEFRVRDAARNTRRTECMPCIRAVQRDRYHANPGAHQDRMRRSTFGLPLGEYDRMLVRQDGRCAICHEVETSVHIGGKVRGLFVDHDHTTGQVRDLLCSRCNFGIGQFRDDAELLRKAMEYLNRHRTE